VGTGTQEIRMMLVGREFDEQSKSSEHFVVSPVCSQSGVQSMSCTYQCSLEKRASRRSLLFYSMTRKLEGAARRSKDEKDGCMWFISYDDVCLQAPIDYVRCAELHQTWNINLAPIAQHARIPCLLQTFGDAGGSGAAGYRIVCES
jgi:hypothetical protein